MSNSYPQSFSLTSMYRKTSEKTGATYFAGRLGNARLVLLKSSDSSDDGSEIWNLLISEARRDNESGQRQEPPRTEPERQQAARSSWQKPLDDEIPF